MYDTLIKQPDNANCQEICVIPYSEAREQIFSFFKMLDPELRERDPAAPKSHYVLNPATTRANLYRQFQELGIQVAG